MIKMKVKEKQQKAKQWKNVLNKINEAQSGEIPIHYKDTDGKKTTGYINLMDIELDINGETISIGDLLTEIINANIETLKLARQTANAIASKDKDLLIVATDDLGYVKAVSNYNAEKNIVIGNQPIPSDLGKGYYYIKDGKFELSEQRKLELYPDFV
jgi:hypothetical protein